MIATPTTAHIWTIEAVCNLGATTDIETAGAIVGIGHTKAYELAKGGEFPVATILRAGATAAGDARSPRPVTPTSRTARIRQS